MTVIFVGDKPSPKMKSGAKPFEGAGCEKRLKAWITLLTRGDIFTARRKYRVVNQCDYKPFFPDDFNFHPVIALGEEASRALTKSNIKHFKLPHPSGRNRILNDKSFVMKKLIECKKWLTEW